MKLCDGIFVAIVKKSGCVVGPFDNAQQADAWAARKNLKMGKNPMDVAGAEYDVRMVLSPSNAHTTGKFHPL